MSHLCLLNSHSSMTAPLKLATAGLLIGATLAGATSCAGQFCAGR